MQKGVVVDLLDEEIRHVSARDEPACPAARIDQRAIGVRLRPIGAGVVARLLDEERFLETNLPNYPEYMRRVPYRLTPLVW
jgi:hypothetical protein